MAEKLTNFGEMPRAPSLAERQAVIKQAERAQRKSERMKRGQGGRP